MHNPSTEGDSQLSRDTELDAPSLVVSRVLATLVIVIAAVALGGWWFDISRAREVLPGMVELKFNTAICLILTSVGMVALGIDSAVYRSLARMVAISAGLIAGLTLTEDMFGWDTGIDALFFDWHRIAKATSGRMSPVTAICLVLCSSTLASGES